MLKSRLKNLLKRIFDENRSAKKNWTKERLETFIFNETTVEHLHRYAFAMGFVKDKKVLDVASGEGYGSNLMADISTEVIGVDIDQVAIEKASLKYQKENLVFRQGNVSKIPVTSDSIDVVVSFETLEHTDEHTEMMEEIVRVLKSDGIMIMSSPDKYYYSDIYQYNNPHHVKELYEKEFRELIAAHFQHAQFYYQRFLKGSLIYSETKETLSTTFSGNYDQINALEKIWGRYLVVVASQQALPNVLPGHSVFESTGIF